MRFPDEVLVGENADGKLYVATVSVGLRPERYIHESKALRYAADKLDEVSQLNDQVASPATTKLLKKHGVGGCEYKGNVCTFERDGKTIKIRL